MCGAADIILGRAAFRGSEVVDYVFLLITGVIAYHGLTYRDEDGESDTGHLLFGCIALVFFLRVLLVDILKLV